LHFWSNFFLKYFLLIFFFFFCKHHCTCNLFTYAFMSWLHYQVTLLFSLWK
jgi:hypothetical protein